MLWDDQVREWKEEAREAGLSEGRREGRKENAIETARKLLKCNVSAGIISECTGLSPEELDSLKKQM